MDQFGRLDMARPSMEGIGYNVPPWPRNRSVGSHITLISRLDLW